MTLSGLSDDDRKWREEREARHRAKTARKPKRGDGGRFAPLNALADDGWVGRLTLGQLRVWVLLFRYVSKDGAARVSHGTISRATGMRRENVARTTKALERLGLLRVRVRGRTVGQGGKRTTNEYEVVVPPRTNSVSSDTIGEDE